MDRYEVWNGTIKDRANISALTTSEACNLLNTLTRKLAAANAKIEKLEVVLRCIENTPPENFISIEGKTEHWWARLVNDMYKQATIWKSEE